MSLTPKHGQQLFLSCLGTIYAIAFLSYWQQYDGLLGSDGLQPIESFLKQTRRQIDHHSTKSPLELWCLSPLLSWFAPSFGIPLDTFHDLIAVCGAVLGALAGFKFCQHGILFLLQWVIYLTLYKSGQTFYSFQWDILLLEVGFASIFYANWSSLLYPIEVMCSLLLNKTKDENNGSTTHNTTSSCYHITSCYAGSNIWPLRFIFFKLMLMSGVVKVQSMCPTWLHLTALEYHFATQCLPTPLAWFTHQIPFPFLRIGVASTLLIEIPFTFMLIAPNVKVRVVGAYFQIFLQIVIILTGTYYMHVCIYINL